MEHSLFTIPRPSLPPVHVPVQPFLTQGRVTIYNVGMTVWKWKIAEVEVQHDQPLQDAKVGVYDLVGRYLKV
jgi:hypothetical protein